VLYKWTFVGIEVKRPKIGKLSEHQKKVLMQLQGCGAVVFVAHSVDEVKQVERYRQHC